MAVVSASQARAQFTQLLIAVYKERIRPTAFLRSFFPTVESLTKYVSIEVQRMNGEKVAVDVERGTKGNRNKSKRFTATSILPPYYNEYFDLTELDLYDRIVGAGDVAEEVFAALMQDAADELQKLIDKIERAYELQCAQVMQTGIVTLASGEANIDYNRQADSKVDLGSGGYWTGAGVNPYTSLETGCNFLRIAGKSQGAIVNAIMGDLAFNAFVNNAKVQGRADIKNFNLEMLMEPQRNSVGAAYHGRVSVGNYLVDLWGYPQFYTDSTGEDVPYIDPTNVVLLPQQTNFKLAFGAVPQLLNDDGSVPQKGAYLVQRTRSEEDDYERIRVKSAGVAVPVDVDKIYTLKATATPSES